MFKFIGGESYKKIDGLWHVPSKCGFMWTVCDSCTNWAVEGWA